MLAAKAGRLKQQAQGSDTHAKLRQRAIKAYGSWEAYESAIRVLEPDQRANYERAGVALQTKQIIFAKAARDADNLNNPNELGVGGARGGGKSFSVFAQVAIDDCQRFPGLKVLYLRKTAKAGQEQMNDLVQSTLSQVDCEPKATRIDFPNGSRIIIGGFKDDSQAMTYQGVEYDVLVIEELTQLTEHTYKTLRLSARSSKGWRPRYYTTFNPLGVGHQWVKKRFVDPYRKNEVSKTQFIPSTVEDNKFNNEEYVENLDDMTGAEKRAYRHGDWDVASGAYFDEWRDNPDIADAHVIPALDKIPSNWTVWASMDYGFNHWNVVHLHAKDHDGVIYTFDELAHRKHQPDEIAPDIFALLAKYQIKLERLAGFFVGNDVFRRTGNSRQTIAEQYKLKGISLRSADVSPGTRVSGAILLSKLLGNRERNIAPRWFITDRCARLRDCMPYLERDPNNSEDVKKVDMDDDGTGGDDAYDCARYGITSMNSKHKITATTSRWA